MKKIVLILLLLCANNVLTAQKTDDCSSILEKSIYNLDGKLSIDFQSNVLFILDCQNYDSLDISILSSGPVLGAIMAESSGKTDFSYHDLASQLNTNYQKEIFTNLKLEIIAAEELSELSFTKQNWNNAYPVFMRINTIQEHMDLIEIELKKSENPETNYHEVFQALTINSGWSFCEPGINVFSLLDNPNVCSSYEEAMERAEIENKPIVLFFSGYTCINSKRMEEDLFCNIEISEVLLKNFILLELYTDDRSLLSNKTGATRTKGERNCEIEIELLGFNRQPIVVILSIKGEVLKTLSYTREKDLFWEFIK